MLLAYTLLVPIFAPFAVKRVKAEPTPASAGGKGPASSPAPKKKAARREDELIIRFRPNASEQEKNTLAESKGARRVKKLRGRTRTEKLKLQKGRDPEAVAAELRLSPSVEHVELNYLLEVAEVVPDDARFLEQWALKNTGQTGGQAGSDINAAPAWETTTGAQTTIIAVIDSGTDFTHPDLQNNLWTNSAEQPNGVDDDGNGLVDDINGWDFVAGDNDAQDEHGHGTMMAGTIAAEGNNWTGTSGVMWRASLMSLRVLNNTGTGDVAAAVEAIDYAVEKGARAINCSWGAEGESLVLREAVERAGQRGVVVVTSAGNSGTDITSSPRYPASYGLPNVIAVASTDHNDQLTSWSNYGSTEVAVAAPGTDVLTTEIGGGYRTATGTSVSAALVTGVVGLMRTVRPSLGPAETKAAVVDGARQVASLVGKVSAAGVLDAKGALDASLATGTTPTPTPTPDGGGSVPGEPAPEGLPDLDAYRDLEPVAPVAPTQIVANTLPVCDADCGGSIPPEGTTNPQDTDFSTERTDPLNAVGGSGVNLLSRNYSWGVPVVSLRGRSGLDLSLALVYNSLVWTKQNGAIRFNADRGFPGAGFRLGFPVIQQRYFNPDAGKYAYMLVTPSGSRVELRQVGTSNVYESADGSYIKMTDNGAAGALVLTPDGTKMSYAPFVNNEMHCTEVKDRNGNYLTIAYNGFGRPTSVVDTLNRTVTFVYDANNYLTSIRQTWNGVSHTWATFSYGSLTVQTNFNGLVVEGPANGSSIPVLTQVGLHDGSRYNFEYTTWGQVWKITHYAADNHTLSYTSFNLPQTAATAQTDCPRFTQQKNWAEDWNGDTNATPAAAEEVLTQYSTATDGSWGQAILPDNITYKETYATGATNWQRGLVTGTETISQGVTKKWTQTLWTQDDTSASYRVNPRPSEMNVYDEAGNRRRVVVQYYPTTSFSLPSDVYEYDANGSTLLRQTHTDYNLTATYNSATRRILGIITKRTVKDGSGTLFSQVEYQYDEGGTFFDTTDAPARHDATNFGTSFIAGRGNLTSVRRINVTTPTQVSEWNLGYNVAGSAVLTRDPSAHTTNIDYTDSFSDATKNSQSTYAYPTKVTDPGGFFSTAQYHYDFGEVTKTAVPSSGTGTSVTYLDHQLTYDTAGRLTKVLNLDDNSYTRWLYPTSQTLVQQYQTVLTPNTAGEVYSLTVFDGAGRTLGVATEHTFGTTPTYSGRLFAYDKMGRRVKQSNPTEMTGAWAATGDDLAVGWQYTQQTYDWKGRTLKTTDPGGAYTETEYGGCGCAGGAVTTLKGEQLAEGRRQQRVYEDALGRVVKTEVLNWDGSVYSTTKNTYNVRDQVTLVRQYQGTDTSTTYQDTVLTYDGHGRLATEKLPEQTDPTVYAYNPDDTLLKVTDARDAYATFTYNSRHLVTNVGYTAPAGSGIPATPQAIYTYDAAGHLDSMTDGVGTVSYTYNLSSRLVAEERHFNALSGGPTGGDYSLTYEYTLNGALKKITDPFNSSVSYTRDEAGRVTAVTGSAYGGVTTYASGVKYRAWGAVKEANLGDGSLRTTAFDTTLKPVQYRLTNPNGYTKLREDFSYYADGSLREVTDLDDVAGYTTMSREYAYDHVGRTTLAGGVNTNGSPTPSPFRQTYGYNAFSNLTLRMGAYGYYFSQTDAPTYTNNKRVGWTYDADGRVKVSAGAPSRDWTYDAAGRLVTTTETPASGPVSTLTNAYDGAGQIVYESSTGGLPSPATYYLVRSSVLGGEVVTRLKATGEKAYTYVPAEGLVFARQTVDYNGQPKVEWTHRDALGVTETGTTAFGAYDALGNLAPRAAPPPQGQPSPPQTGAYYGPIYGGAGSSFTNATNYSTGCRMTLDGAPADCNSVMMGRESLSFDRINNPASPGGVVSFANAVWVPDNSRERSSEVLGGTSDSSVTVYAGDGGHFETVGEAEVSNAFSQPPLIQQTPYPGGSPNPYAQLGPCLELVVPTFAAINKPAATLLKNTYGSDAEAKYGSMSTYEQAVFLNTAAAADSVGVNLSNAQFSGFYISDKPGNLPYGFYVTGISGVTSGRHKDIGSVEIGRDKNGRHIDVDLYNPFDHPFKHRREFKFNEKYDRPTHPGDVTQQLKARGVKSGVDCK